MGEPSARIRLYVILGLGAPAASYTDWVSPETINKYPKIEVAVVELPGHGMHKGEVFYNIHEASRSVAAVITRLQFADAFSGEKRPFAFYGHSLGATLAWEMARRIRGKGGESCTKVYLSCRAGPHLGAPEQNKEFTSGGKRVRKKRKRRTKYYIKFPEKGDKPDFSNEDLQELNDWGMDLLEYCVDDAQLKKYDRYLKVLQQRNPEKLIEFAETLYSDLMIGALSMDVSKEGFQLRLNCPVHLYHSDGDESWPQESDEGEPDELWPSLKESWEKYAPTGRYTNYMYHDISHGDMGSPDTPVFNDMLSDLSNLA